ncbi:MAG: hypothetical protein JNK41_03745 [Saprospiraceae bacterium]|nr:hypothetical protein [Saprospiraceae bacterium]
MEKQDPHPPAPNLIDLSAKEKQKQSLFLSGLLWLLAGMVLMGMSFCMIFCLDHAETSVLIFMYALTGIGAACGLKGLANLIGF